jgi:hypothetical protein
LRNKDGRVWMFMQGTLRMKLREADFLPTMDPPKSPAAPPTK